jgi:nucleotide-binding universal stress UspA family protein
VDIKQILVVLAAETPCETALALAARLAGQHGATVAGVCVFHEPSADPADSHAIGRQAVSEVLEHRHDRVLRLTAPAETAFHKAMDSRGLSDGWTVGEIEEWSQTVVQRARLADLIVVCRTDQDSAYRRLVENLALQSGAPCIIAPPEARPETRREFARVLLAWNGTREAKRAMDDALPFLKRASAVRVVIAREDATRWIGPSQVAALARHLARHGIEADVIRSEGRERAAADVLETERQAFGADLLVMGAFSRSRASERILGGATHTLIGRASVPVLLSH